MDLTKETQVYVSHPSSNINAGRGSQTYRKALHEKMLHVLNGKLSALSNNF